MMTMLLFIPQGIAALIIYAQCAVYNTCSLQNFAKDPSNELQKYCLGHLFTCQEFVDPPGSKAYVYGLAYIGSPNAGSGMCASECYDTVSVLPQTYTYISRYRTSHRRRVKLCSH